MIEQRLGRKDTQKGNNKKGTHNEANKKGKNYFNNNV
jgi:hypothetical protein